MINIIEKILISGANGFLGSHLTDFCLELGFKVYAFDLPDYPLKNLHHYTNGQMKFSLNEKLHIFEETIQIPTKNENLVFIEGDLKNSQLIERMIREINPKYIFHFGAQPLVIPSWKNPVNTIETSVIGTINIFEPKKI